MSTMAEPKLAPDGEALSDWERAADDAINACDGDPRTAVLALLAMNHSLERELALTRIAVSSGFPRQWHHDPFKRKQDGKA
jgi:hypothetical protein